MLKFYADIANGLMNVNVLTLLTMMGSLLKMIREIWFTLLKSMYQYPHLWFGYFLKKVGFVKMT